ncbi:MAG: hypothetical protein NT003_01355 [Candidatus Magasanikbacteria bacterium]|nr:hypothetical protein [Candidatus Magasanikbacteria bacterium]
MSIHPMFRSAISITRFSAGCALVGAGAATTAAAIPFLGITTLYGAAVAYDRLKTCPVSGSVDSFIADNSSDTVKYLFDGIEIALMPLRPGFELSAIGVRLIRN